MTADEVEKHVEGIKAAAAGDDDEVAHIREDKLYRTLLEAIAKDLCHDAQDLAKRALKTQDLDFHRWCA